METFIKIIVFCRNRAFTIGLLSTMAYFLIFMMKGYEDFTSMEVFMIIWLWVSMLVNKFFLADMILEQLSKIKST